ncbi:MAG TPA: secretion protein, partial [Burkholderiaceae bacterium]|nr:secretion protein [Burkholderiaceae bacterium]
LLVEGDELSDADRERVIELAKRYPQLLDFTGVVGWDSMVMLDVQVLELPRSYLREVGVRWSPTAEGGLNAGLAWDGGTKRLAERPGQQVVAAAYPLSPMAGYLGVNALLSAQLDAMIQTGQATVLAQPQLLARSGSPAEFLAGGEVPYSTTDANGNPNTEFKPYGVSLSIVPQIERNRRVRSRVEVEVSAVDTTYSMVNGPALKTRRAATEFNVQSGETLVLAGFVSRDDARNSHSVPGLANIPILGELFRSRRFQRNETELAIFVTPVVVSASHPGMRERVQRGRALMDVSLGSDRQVNVDMTERDVDIVGGISASVHEQAGWNPWRTHGSQWRSNQHDQQGD